MEQNKIKYDLPAKARIVLETAVVITMVAAPFAYVYSMIHTAVVGLWAAFITMPIEVRHRIMDEYIAKGIAKPRVNLTE